MRFMGHLPKDAVGNIVIAAPVRRPFSEGKLIHIMAVQFASQSFGGGIDFTRALDKVTASAIKLNLLNFAFCRTGRHDGDKRQTEQTRKVGFRNRRRAGRGFDNRRPFLNPAVTQAVKEQRARQAVFQAAGRMGALIFQVDLNTREPGQRQANKVRVGGTLIIGVDFTDCVFYPGAIHRHFLFVILCPA